MYTRQNLANAERQMWRHANEPRIGIVKQLLNKLLGELDAVIMDGRVALDENFNLHEQLKNFESDIIRQALSLTGNNQRLAARLLGVNYTTLNAKMKRLGICGKTDANASLREV